MMPALWLFGAASALAAEYDWLFWALVVVCGAVALGIACFVVYSAVRYHRRTENQIGDQNRGNLRLEILWSAIPLFIFMGMFAWGTSLYFDIERPPDNAIPVYVVAKQWMWKVQYVDGRREINELHVPVGRPVKLILTSQDVIHSFYVPDFRVKQDVLPDRYRTIWFEASQAGKYHLFCAEYCGTKHSGMIGWVYAMEQREYQQWLAEGGAEGSLASTGEKMFHQFGCANCHHFDGHGPGPDLQGLYMRPVHLANGDTVVADESYLRQCIVDPRVNVVAGFDRNIMPAFKDVIQEEQIVELIAYIKALGPPPGAAQPTSSGTADQPYGTQPGIAQPGATGNAGTEPGVR